MLSQFRRIASRANTIRLPASRVAPRIILAQDQPQTQKRFATQDYGSGGGSPVGENPQEQGKNPKGNLEHPGPSAPDTSSGGSSSGSEGMDKQQVRDTKGEAKPKFNTEPMDQSGEDVKKHNDEVANRREKQAGLGKDGSQQAKG